MKRQNINPAFTKLLNIVFYFMASITFSVLPDPSDKFTDSKRQAFANNAGDFKIEYGEKNEVRMGLFASEVKVFKKGKDITDQILEKNFYATVPRPFEPMSVDRLYTFIPTCPIRHDPRLIVLNTRTLEKHFIDVQGATTANQFAKSNNFLLITGYTRVVLYDCDTTSLSTIFIKNDNEYIEYAFFSSDEIKIIMLLTDNERLIQTINLFDFNGVLQEKTAITPPSEIFNFDFEKYKLLAKSDRYNLFNSSGYAFSATGRSLNKWHFMDHDKANHTLTLRTYVPVSEIYLNNEWEEQGCDIRVKEAAVSVVLG